MADLSEQLREAEAELAAAREAWQNMPPREGKITDWPEFQRAEAAINRVEELKAALRGETRAPRAPALRDACVDCGAPGATVRESRVFPRGWWNQGVDVKEVPVVRARRCDACETKAAARRTEAAAKARAYVNEMAAAPRSPAREARPGPGRAAAPTDDARQSILDALGV